MKIHRPVQANRLFRPDKTYAEIAWGEFPEVVSEFRNRLEAWYLQPAKVLAGTSDFAFSVMALNCLFIDALSQYRYGAQQSPTEALKNCTNKRLESSHFKFEDFIADRIPELATPVAPPIRTGRLKNNNQPETLSTLSEVLYTGFRCGILHEAHVALYGALTGQETIASVESTGLCTYADTGADCPTIVVFPQKLLGTLVDVFSAYLGELVNPDAAFDALRARFKEKFEDSFGVQISIQL